jgi:hypothetical protein
MGPLEKFYDWVVAVFIVELMTIAVAINVKGAMDHADHDIALLDVLNLRGAVEGWQTHHTSLPDDLDALVPSEVRRLRPDPWGTPYVYVRRGECFEVRSLGPDRVPSGDDIQRDTGGEP